MRITSAFLFFGTAAALYGQRPQPPADLRCEYLVNPQGIDAEKPRLYWTPVHTGRAEKQTAYQILVSADAKAAAGDIWDSGKVASGEFTHIAYGGKPLQSGGTYYWKVQYWDSAGRPSGYSRVASFGMGLLRAAEWKGKWIAGGNQLRKEFTLAAKPLRARAYVSGAGYYELRINGHKVGNHVLDPAYTPYEKRVLYATYDVTRMLEQGANAAGLMTGEGWFGSRAGMLQLNVELPGGQVVEIHTDETWKAAQGPIVSDSIYQGETYDARKETPGWDRAGFDDTAWKPAVAASPAPKGVLSAQMMPPIRVTGEVTPRSLTSPKPGVWVYDMGQNFSGWVRLRVKGAAGAAVKIRHAELLYEDGTLNVENLRSARATDVYVLKGAGVEEVYEPRFTYHGFRFVELTGFPGTPKMGTVTGRVVHTDARPVGGFSASKPVLNQIQHLILWGTTSNLHSIPTDCNQRDERMGWMADAHLNAETAILNFDMAAVYSMWIRSMRDNQEDDGSVPDTVPRARFARGAADPAWGAAYPLILWYMYKHYGDRHLLAQHFEGIRKWADFLESKNEGGVLNIVKFGDWVPVEKTPGQLVSTAYWYYSADIVARAAAVQGKTAEAQKYRRVCDGIKDAFHKKFYNPELRYYSTGTQTAQLLPLWLDMVPKDLVAVVRTWMRDDIVYRNNTHLTTGILGTKYLLPYLDKTGSPDLAYDLAVQTTYPSWGYMIERGATTLWELWQEKTGPSMNSHNHPMFGSMGAWLYTGLAGIDMADDAVGYDKMRVVPRMVRDLQWASGSTETVRGLACSAWKRDPGGATLELTVPFGSTAEVLLPRLNLISVTLSEGGTVIWQNEKPAGTRPGISNIQEAADRVTLTAGSGSYSFTLRGE